MQVWVKLFATLRKYAPDGESAKPFLMDVNHGTRLINLLDMLDIPEESVRVKFVNGRARNWDYVLEPDDEVGIFPPIGGG
jgi:molybdopterin converting factor small subunit